MGKLKKELRNPFLYRMTLIYIREYLLQFEDLCKAFMYMENLEDRSEVDIEQDLQALDARLTRKPVY